MIYAVAIVAIGLILFATSLYSWHHLAGAGDWRYIKLLYALVGFYWSIVYAYIALAPAESWQNAAWSGVWIRPALMLTLAIFASGAIQGARRKNGNGKPPPS